MLAPVPPLTLGKLLGVWSLICDLGLAVMLPSASLLLCKGEAGSPASVERYRYLAASQGTRGSSLGRRTNTTPTPAPPWRSPVPHPPWVARAGWVAFNWLPRDPEVFPGQPQQVIPAHWGEPSKALDTPLEDFLSQRPMQQLHKHVGQGDEVGDHRDLHWARRVPCADVASNSLVTWASVFPAVKGSSGTGPAELPLGSAKSPLWTKDTHSRHL